MAETRHSSPSPATDRTLRQARDIVGVYTAPGRSSPLMGTSSSLNPETRQPPLSRHRIGDIADLLSQHVEAAVQHEREAMQEELRELKQQNDVLRRELEVLKAQRETPSLGSALHNLRHPAVPLEQYQQLLAVTEKYADMLRAAGVDPDKVPYDMPSARNSPQTLPTVPVPASKGRDLHSPTSFSSRDFGQGTPPPPARITELCHDEPARTETPPLDEPHKIEVDECIDPAYQEETSQSFAEELPSDKLNWFQPGKAELQWSPSFHRRPVLPLASRNVKTHTPAKLLTSLSKVGPRGASSIISIPVGLPGPTLSGNWEPLLEEGKLFKLQIANVGNMELYFYNGTRDTHFTLEYHFSEQSALEPGDPDVQRQGNTFVMTVPSGETKLFVVGRVNGYRMTVKYGPPSQAYLLRLAKHYDEKITRQLQLIKQGAQQQGVDLKKDREVIKMCQKLDIQYVDWRFPPRQTSLCRPWEGTFTVWPWMRPQDYLTPEVAATAHLFIQDDPDRDPIQPNDIDQGKLGDCWLLCAVGAIAEIPDLVRRLFFISDVTSADHKVGAYTLRICKHGWWQTVVVDNYLPSYGKYPVFSSNIQEPQELWVSMLEKAMAKVHGSYMAISSGDSLEALQDLTGYPAERFQWHDPDLFDRVLMFHDATFGDTYVMTMETPGVDRSERVGGTGEGDKRYKDIGLVEGHAYTLVTVKRVYAAKGPKEGFKLCRIRNPWGNANDWKGRWSNNDESWRQHPEVAEACGQRGNDGTFWMEWSDVQKWFSGGGVCFVSLSWHDIRIATEFRSGVPVHMLEIWPEKESQCFIGLHQRDRRGLERNDKDKIYGAFLITVVEPLPNGGWIAAKDGTSHGGNYWRGRDCYLHFSFPATQLKRPYYIIWQCYSTELTKQVVISLHAEKKFGSIVLKQPNEAVLRALQYQPIWNFDPAPCPKAPARVQLNVQEDTVQEIFLSRIPDPPMPTRADMV